MFDVVAAFVVVSEQRPKGRAGFGVRSGDGREELCEVVTAILLENQIKKFTECERKKYQSRPIELTGQVVATGGSDKIHAVRKTRDIGWI